MKSHVLLLVLASFLALASIVAAGQGALARSPERVPVIIAFKHRPGPADAELVRRVGGTVHQTYHLVPAIAADVPAAALKGLRANPNVAAVDLDGRVYAADAELDGSWGVKRIGAGAVHDGGNGGAGVKVAVIDTGIDAAHPDLDANYRGGHDFVNDDADPSDDHGHGTHVAGIACAEDNGDGVVGAAPACELYGLKVLGADGSGSWSDIIGALQWAVDNGVQVANLSLGSSQDPGTTVRQAFDNAAAAGVVIVAAAGNSGNVRGKGDKVEYPGRFDSVIAVAATDSSDSRAGFSSTGDAVELAAPGVGVTSTWPGGGYRSASGTSMASPHVAGTAALVIGAGITDAAGVRQALRGTADDLGAAGRDPLYGYGLVDADEAAVPAGPVDGAPTVSITSPADGATFGSGAVVTLSGTAGDTEDGDLSGGIAWTSSIDGALGTGAAVSAALSDGTHTITASVSDSAGHHVSTGITITVGDPPPQASGVRVDAIGYVTTGGKSNDKHLNVTVTLVDDLGRAVEGATVAITLRNTTAGASWTGSGTTASGGTVTFGLKNAPAGCYTTEVTGINAAGLAWDGVTPSNGACK